MSHYCARLQIVPGTITEACDYAATHHLARSYWRLILIPEDLQPGVPCVLIGTWALRLNPDTLNARLAELGIQPEPVPA